MPSAQPVVKGDATSASIGAASVLAKVSRDRYMLELGQADTRSISWQSTRVTLQSCTMS